MAVVSAVTVPIFFVWGLAMAVLTKTYEDQSDYEPSGNLAAEHFRKCFRYDPFYIWTDFVCKTLISCCVAFLGRSTDGKGYVVLGVLAVTSATLLYLNHTMSPCTLDCINSVRHYTLMWSLLSCAFGTMVSLVADGVITLGWAYVVVGGALLVYSVSSYVRASHERSREPLPCIRAYLGLPTPYGSLNFVRFSLSYS
jgi:hypothetical protein